MRPRAWAMHRGLAFAVRHSPAKKSPAGTAGRRRVSERSLVENPRRGPSVRSVRDPRTAKPIIQSDLRGVDTGKFVIKAKLPTPYRRSGSKAREATRCANVTISKANEHVLGFDTPVPGESPFKAAAQRRSCNGLRVLRSKSASCRNRWRRRHTDRAPTPEPARKQHHP